MLEPHAMLELVEAHIIVPDHPPGHVYAVLAPYLTLTDRTKPNQPPAAFFVTHEDGQVIGVRGEIRELLYLLESEVSHGVS